MKKEKWVLIRKGADFNQLAQKFNISPLTARLIVNRGVKEDEMAKYLYGGKDDLYDPFLLKDMDIAVEILADKIADGAKIRIIGDYDIDGVMGTAVLYLGLKRAGADVDADIPDRFVDGYGMSNRLVKKAIDDGIDTIITVDNGIAAFEQIEFAKSNAMTVVVTDHHEIASIPGADAVINPKREDNEYPFRELCGAAVGYKLIIALYSELGIPIETAEDLLSYAAFATVGDIVSLKDENRIIVRTGMEILRSTDNIGMRALFEAAGADVSRVNAYTIGYVIGPCINASGRLNTALEAFRLIVSDDEAEVKRIASKLKALNEERKVLTQEAAQRAMEIVRKEKMENDKVLVIYIPDCHESVAGIVAGRVKEEYFRPTFILTDSKGMLKGSGRSVEMYNMFEEMSKIKEIFEHFGGHAMAAGLTLKKDNLEKFRKMINDNCSISSDEFAEIVRIDADPPLNYMTEKLIQEIELLEPFGSGNSRPHFAVRNIRFENPKLIGERKNILKANAIRQDGRLVDAVCFNSGDELMKLIREGKNISVVYHPNINEYNGERSVQLIIDYFC
ncbi:MAG: single-stranded-DNA-specific exonuclease RecJ [Lachnospiraceae bacterium]|jgi:single-stranded-DNA-specific exonuclease